MSLRWTCRRGMRHLLRLAGYAVEFEFSDFLGSPPACGKDLIWVARSD